MLKDTDGAIGSAKCAASAMASLTLVAIVEFKSP
jgi:hypothetical protein